MPLLKCSASASDSDLPVIPLIRKKVVVVGDAESGKTWLLHRFAKNCRPSVYVSTVYEHYTVDKDGVRLSLWDTAGKDDLCCSLRPLYYPETDLVILCFDVSRRDSLANVKNRWLPEVKHYCPKVPILLVGNKTDKRVDDKNDGETEDKKNLEVGTKEICVVNKEDDGEKDVKLEGGVNVKENNAVDIKENDADSVRGSYAIDITDDSVNNGSVDNNGGGEMNNNTGTDVDISVNKNIDLKFETYSGDGTRSSYESYEASIASNQDIIDAFFKEGQLYRENIPDQKWTFERQRTVQSILQKGLSMTKSGWDGENEIEPDENREESIPKNEETIMYDEDGNKIRKVSSIVKKGLLMSKDGWTNQQAKNKVEKKESLYSSREIINDVIDMALNESKVNYKIKDRNTKEDYLDNDLTKLQSSPKFEAKNDKIKDDHKKSNNNELRFGHNLSSATLVSQVMRQQNSQDNLAKKDGDKDTTESLNDKEMSYIQELPSTSLVRQVMKKENMQNEETAVDNTESQASMENPKNDGASLESELMEILLMMDQDYGQQSVTKNQEKKDEVDIFNSEFLEAKRDDTVEESDIIKNADGGDPLVNINNDMKRQDVNKVNCEKKYVTKPPESEKRNMKLDEDNINHDISSNRTDSLERNNKVEIETTKTKIKNKNLDTVSKNSINNDQMPSTEVKKEKKNKLISEESINKRKKLTVTSKSPSIFEKFRASLQTDESLVQVEEGKTMANQIGAIAYVECSAKKVNGISEVFDIAIKLEKMKNKNMKNTCKCNVL